MTARKKESTALRILAALATFGVFAGSNEPILSVFTDTWVADAAYKLHLGNSILYDISVGVLISIIFWWLLVERPQTRKQILLKSALQRHYGYFKEDVIQILLSASGDAYDSELCEQLLDREKFKEHFRADDLRQWYATLNGLQDDPTKISDLLVEMDLLWQEISHFLGSVEIDSDDAHAFFKRLSAHIYKLKHSSVYTHDHVKYLGNFIWEIFAGWSFIEGYRKSDIIQDMIDSI